MIKPERWNDVEFADADEVFDEKGLVIGGAVLIERDGGRSGAARRVEESGTGVGVIQRVALERRLTVINDAAEGERAAAEHAIAAPAFTGAKIDAAVIEFLVTNGGAGGEDGPESVSGA